MHHVSSDEKTEIRCKITRGQAVMLLTGGEWRLGSSSESVREQVPNPQKLNTADF